jgi:hypothetical protein
LIVLDRDFNADLGEEIDHVFSPSIDLRMAFLAAIACPSSNASEQSEQCWNGGSGSFGVRV